MELSAPRELLPLSPEWSMPQILQALRSSLDASGPAIGFGELSPQQVDPSIAIVVGTSGSTGEAKLVGLTAQAISTSVLATHSLLKPASPDRWSLLLPLTHIAGVMVLARSLDLGTELIDNRNTYREGSDNYRAAEFTAIVPTQLHRALTSDNSLLNHLKSMKLVLLGGAAASAHMIHDAKTQGINIMTTYGMSETCGGCVYDGRPLPGVEIRLNEQSLIEIRTPTLASGYLNDSVSWNSRIRDGWYVTSDIGRLDDGKLIVLGRVDDIINSGGEKISLSQIENEIQANFPNQPMMSFSVPDDRWGEVLGIASDSEINRSEIERVILAKFPRYALPKIYFVTEQLPVRGIGKPDRASLRKMYEDFKGKEKST